MNVIETQELLSLLKNPHVKLLDLRQIDAYNGWPLAGEKRGGHIPGAKALPFAWTKFMDWIDIVQSKDIKPEDQIVLYGYDMEECMHAQHHFQRHGYRNVRIYPYFLDQWTTDPSLPLDQMARYKMLVPPQWIKTLIEGHRPDFYDNDKYILLHVHFRNVQDYVQGHIPGSIEFDTLLVESAKDWNRRNSQDLKYFLESKGITNDTTVIVYGRFSNPTYEDPFPGSKAGHLGALRTAAILLYAGVEDVRILNGGFYSWEQKGFPVTTEAAFPPTVYEFGSEIPANPWVFIDTPEARQYLVDPDKELVCVRSLREYIGEFSGYHYIDKKGHIPGAVFGNCGSDAYHMENYRNPDYTTREFHEIEQMWKELGITPDKHVAFYCGTGWRGSEAWLNAYLMGWNNVSIYDGGWLEWSSDPGNPIEVGPPDDLNLKE